MKTCSPNAHVNPMLATMLDEFMPRARCETAQRAPQSTTPDTQHGYVPPVRRTVPKPIGARHSAAWTVLLTVGHDGHLGGKGDGIEWIDNASRNATITALHLVGAPLVASRTTYELMPALMKPHIAVLTRTPHEGRAEYMLDEAARLWRSATLLGGPTMALEAIHRGYVAAVLLNDTRTHPSEHAKRAGSGPHIAELQDKIRRAGLTNTARVYCSSGLTQLVYRRGADFHRGDVY